MNEVVTVLTSASGHSLVKSFRGPDLTKQNFSIGNSFQVVEEQVSDNSGKAVLYLPKGIFRQILTGLKAPRSHKSMKRRFETTQ